MDCIAFFVTVELNYSDWFGWYSIVWLSIHKVSALVTSVIACYILSGFAFLKPMVFASWVTVSIDGMTISRAEYQFDC